MGIIEQHLKAKKLSASELSRRAGISRSALSRYLSGERIPTVEALQRLAKATRIPISKLARNFSYLSTQE